MRPDRQHAPHGNRQAKAREQSPSRDRRRAAAHSSFILHHLAIVLALASLGLTGCGQDLDAVYGQRKGPFWASVNGTGVLGKMFEQAGHTVYSWRSLSPRLWSRADCIVWFPNDFEPPSEEVCLWLESWLEDYPGRTLIYVGRDFDAAPWYWDKIEPDAPADQQKEIRRRKANAKTLVSLQRKLAGKSEECPWFSVQAKSGPGRVRSLKGDPRWTEGIDASQLEVEVNGRLVPSPYAEVVLESGKDVLVTSERFGESRLIVVANGSFLLNLPLVNHEHRKLAGQLIDEVGPSGQTVVFLESGPGGPSIFTSDPTAGPPSGWEIFRRWPTNWILLHLAVVGIILCFSRFPIFGRPRVPEPKGASDFGRHIQALGELLEKSKDRAHATTRLLHYQQTTRRDSIGARPTADRAGKQ